MKKFFRLIWVYIVHTKIGKLVLSLLLAFIFGVLAENTEVEWFDYAMYAMLVYPVGLTLVMIAYAWVINPLRDLKERRKEREKNKQ